MSNLLIKIGGMIVIIGLILKFIPGLSNWFGKLPGDIRIENEHSFIFMPITSMIIVSLLLTLIINIFFR